tara:strand:- start:2722 stop:3384 length:663 start_codon:yes stop_codon:yes gene_type:complete
MDFVSQYVYTNSDACLLCLENEHGHLLDSSNRPILLSIGMIHGSFEDMKKQVDYALHRAKSCQIENGICSIIESNHKSFRFPDYNVRKLFQYIRNEYEECEHGYIHIVGLTRLYKIGFNFALRFVPLELRNIFIIHDSYESLHTYLKKESMLTRWNGNIAFDIDDYVKWRCADEKCIESLNKAHIEINTIKSAHVDFLKFYKSSTLWTKSTFVSLENKSL